MVDLFRKVFAKPAEPVPLPLPNPIPAMLLGKPEVMPSWFDGLMAPIYYSVNLPCGFSCARLPREPQLLRARKTLQTASAGGQKRLYNQTHLDASNLKRGNFKAMDCV
jgi:hypothetical protein